MLWVVAISVLLLAVAVAGGVVIGRRVRTWDKQEPAREISGEMRTASFLFLALGALVAVLWLATDSLNWSLLRDAGYVYALVMAAIFSRAFIKRRRQSRGRPR